MQHEWRPFPTWWVRRHRLKELSAGQATTGENVATLKVFLALAVATDEDGIAGVSYTRLADLTGLSRPMVSIGVKRLRELGIVAVDTSQYVNRYELVQPASERHWMKIPIEVVQKHLREIPNSTQAALAALKIYLVLLTVRQRKSPEAPISHKALQKYTAVRPGLIAKGMSILIACGFVRFTNSPPRFNPAGYRVNNHHLFGKFLEGGDDTEVEDEETEPMDLKGALNS